MAHRARPLDGRTIADEMRREVCDSVRSFAAKHGVVPTLAVVRVGVDPASERYARQIVRTFERSGMEAQVSALPESASQDEVLSVVHALNHSPRVHGILVQVPLPPQIDQDSLLTALAPEKDVDGVHPLNAGRLLMGRGRYHVPATALGGLELLRRSGCQIAGRHAVVVGRSVVVGKPLALLLLQEQATVTICHSRTPDLAHFTRQADILAVAVGRPGLITPEMVHPHAVVVDFGMNVVGDRLVGDVADGVWDVADAMTPVPGGTGPMTNAVLLWNTLRAAQWQMEPSGGAPGETCDSDSGGL